jgi:glycosyltransferase involved in cell wall biosynthesis
VRILCVNDRCIDDPEAGGAEVYLGRLVDGLRASGDDVSVFAGYVTHAGVGRALDLWDPAVRRQLATLVVRERPDVVHFHNVTRELSVSSLLVPAPRVLTAHDMTLAGTPDPRRSAMVAVADRMVKRPLDRLVARRCLDEVVAVSGPVGERLRSAGFPRVTVLPVPVAAPTSAPHPVSECSDVVFVGRWSADKGVLVLIEAWRRICRELPESRLVLAGDGPLRAEVEEAVVGLPIDLLGRLTPEGVSRLLGRARVVVVPSQPHLRPEGASLATAEAAAHGRPVVCSNDPAVLDVASALPGCTAVPAGDVDRLAAAIRRLVVDREFAVRRGAANARTALGTYGIERLVEGMHEVYARAIARRCVPTLPYPAGVGA